MDNIPSKHLIARTDLKVPQNQEQDKRMSLDSPSIVNLKGEDSVRQKFRENLAEALRSGASKESNLTDETSLQHSDVHLVEESLLNGRSTVEKKSVENLMTGPIRVEDQFMSLKKENSITGEADMNWPSSNWMSDTDSKLAVQDLERQSLAASNYPSKRVKIETDIDIEDRSMPNLSRKGNVVDYAKVVAFAIEAELFRSFGSVNKKYKEKARSLLFNLKDRSNPELRTKVLSGEISPGNLCGMTAEQLASKELSEWRMAKAEELAQMVVLTEADLDPRRMVKKTHKGEFSVEAAEKENLDLVPTTLRTTLIRQASALFEKEQVEEADVVLVRRLQPSSLQQRKDSTDEVYDRGLDGDVSRSLEETRLLTDSKENDLKETSMLPEILSLDEYIKFQANGSNLDLEEVSEMEISHSKSNIVSGKELGTESKSFKQASLQISDSQIYAGQLSTACAINTFENVSESSKMLSLAHNDILWEGSLQFTGANTVSVHTFYQSGKKTDLKDWPKVVQVEGTLRAETLGDFLRKLPMSRSRSLMIISFHASDESGSSIFFLKEIADQYTKTERVGVANHNTDKELYLCPPGDSMWDFLCDYVDIRRPDIGSIGEGALLGFVVWKQPQTLLRSSHKSAHGKKATDVSRKLNESSRTSNKAVIQTGAQESIAVAPPIETSSFANVLNFSPPLSMPSNFQTKFSVYDGQPLVSQAILANSTPMQSAGIMTEENPHYLAGKYALNSHAIDMTDDRTDVIDGPPGFCPPLLRSFSNKDQHAGTVESTSRGILGPKPGLESHQNIDAFDELPPGFGPRQAVNPSVHLKLQNIAQNDEDDLPEYDFETLSHVIGAPSQKPNAHGVLEAPIIRPVASFQPPLPPGPRPIFQPPVLHHNTQLPLNQPNLNQGDGRGVNLPPNQVFSCLGIASGAVTNRNIDSFASANNAVLMQPEVTSNQHVAHNIERHSNCMVDDDMPEWFPKSMTVPGLQTNLPSPVFQRGLSAGSINERFSSGPVFAASSSLGQPPLPPNPPPPLGVLRPQQPPFLHEAPWMPPNMLYRNFAAPVTSKQMHLGPGTGRGLR